MALQTLFLLACLFLSHCQASTLQKAEPETRISRNETRISINVGPVATSFGPDYPVTLKFVGYIKGASGYYCNIIIINKYYAVAPQDQAAIIGNPVPVDTVAVAYCTTFDNCELNSESRKVRQIIPYSGATGCPKLVDCISLIRTCPGWPDNFYEIPIASALSPTYRNVDTYIGYLQYDFVNNAAQLVGMVKYVAEYCECQNIAGLFLEKHVCVGENIDAYGTTDDDASGLIAVRFSADGAPPTVTEILGFMVRYQDPLSTEGNAELILYIGHADYLAWYDVDADPANHEYPPE